LVAGVVRPHRAAEAAAEAPMAHPCLASVVAGEVQRAHRTPAWVVVEAELQVHQSSVRAVEGVHH
jgi:hypothetical protein